ncbi:ArsR family transcriptional regulator [Cohnella kolymensis]|uniref:ArsR family transcriptional regulator n=1 Tax=Cohnella kolymensis TaxID=1590652 RepID=A0ABR5A2U0_9BACL|nr:helix-turn-helix domain-containing protein [Cohnella kolymensis]KIL34722.1 ArsR family transcriptional regulator [Cohnella kolymensis]
MAEFRIQEVYRLESPEQALALLNPLRAEILRMMNEPSSATEVGRQLGESPQKINYHLKSLEKVGLLRRSGTRQVKNLIEVLYQAVARTFIIPESFGWSEDTVERMKDQGALRHLITVSERMRSDAMRLMEASDEAAEIASAALETDVYLPAEADREAFIRDYAEAMKKLAQKYRTDDKDNGYRVLMAVYPDPDQGGKRQ